MSRVTEDELALFHDGELSHKDAERVGSTLMSASEAERERLRRLDKLGDFVRFLHEEQCSEVSFDGFAERVAAGIRAQKKPSAMSQVWFRLGQFFETRRVIWIPATSFVGAAAAVLLAIALFGGAPELVPPLANPAPGIWQASAAIGSPLTGRRVSEAVLENRDQVSGVELSVLTEQGEAIGIVWVNE